MKNILRLKFSKTASQKFNELVIRTKSQDDADLVKDALRLYDYITEKVQDGYEVNIVRGDETIQLTFSDLEKTNKEKQ